MNRGRRVDIGASGDGEPLRQVAVGVRPGDEGPVAALLESECGSPPVTFTDLTTGECTVSAYLPLSRAQAAPMRSRLQGRLKALCAGGEVTGPVTVRMRRVPARDWSESWKRHFKPIAIGQLLLVLPTWSRRRPRSGQVRVLLDPGLSFGTGQHATTRYCLERIVALRRPDRLQSLWDVGTGSGLLAIAAARLGYGPVGALDHDPAAVRIAGENCRLNGVADRIVPEVADLTRLPRRPDRRYDVVCANLMADLLVSERARLVARLKSGGALVVAGILREQFPSVERALEGSGLRRCGARTEGEWRSGWFRAP
ncbi:MAG: 50S ribosomal protein L11 methyltransferase [Verrucomicrobiae bacterium]|nr:50S ribosomal protein L11 methyltransferase [Verrucomicrobiae bacterium]